jgi:hypothetical protein
MSSNPNKAAMPQSQASNSPDIKSNANVTSHSAPIPQTKPSLKIKLSLTRSNLGQNNPEITAVVINEETKEIDSNDNDEHPDQEPMDADSESLMSNADAKSEDDSLRTAQEDSSLLADDDMEDAQEQESEVAGEETLSALISRDHDVEEDDRSSIANSQESGSAIGSGVVRRGRTRSTSFDAKEVSPKANVLSVNESPLSALREESSSVVVVPKEPKARTSLSFIQPLLPATSASSTQTGKAQMTSSFLDSLSEGQKRTMTRHLPDVSGFRRLHKSEIKRDLAAIKAMLKTSSNGGSGSSQDSTMAVDEEGSNDGQVHGSEEGLESDEEEATSQSKSVDLARAAQTFMLPHPGTESHFLTSTGPKSDTKENKNDSEGLVPPYSSPHVIESITAFNPPRPPESVGPKKQHRLERWERNPQDVELNLANYRKTVDKTREELHKAEAERDRLLTAGHHLKRHYMNQWRGMRQETAFLQKHFLAIQEECVEAAELLTSKTRSRGSGRGAYIMKDVLAVLKSRGEQAPTSLSNSADKNSGGDGASWCVPGVGGVCADANNAMLAGGWILPQDKVSTPYGDGSVLQSFGARELNCNSSSTSKKYHNQPPQSKELHSQQSILDGGIVAISPPRICVELSFGKGYFNPNAVSVQNNPAAFSDEMLALRWKSMMESGMDSWSSMDVLGMESFYAKARPKGDDMEDGTGSNGDGDNVNIKVMRNRLVPFGSGLLPLSSVPGGGFENLSLEQLENTVASMLHKNGGILGDVSFFSISSIVICRNTFFTD